MTRIGVRSEAVGVIFIATRYPRASTVPARYSGVHDYSSPSSPVVHLPRALRAVRAMVPQRLARGQRSGCRSLMRTSAAAP